MANLVVSDNNRHYEIVKFMGEGGFGAVFKVQCKEDGKIYAFRFFASKQGNLELAKAQNNIKQSIEGLIKKPITYPYGKMFESFIGPLEMVSNVPEKEGFGYIFEYVDVSECGTLYKSWKQYDKYRPDAKQTCEICIKIAEIFDRIHASGRGYNEINEGNIYFNLKNGRVYFMDCDNVVSTQTNWLFPSIGYAAPEVYVTGVPTAVSDRFSMAVYFYRLMVGGYPLEGKKTARYIIDNGLDDGQFPAAKKVYSEMALFAFDEKDKSNSIENVTDPKIPDTHKASWNIQAIYWKLLPDSIRGMFQKVFSENLKGDAKDRRPTENQWIRVFYDVLQNGIVKCECGKHNYVNNDQCLFCGEKLK